MVRLVFRPYTQISRSICTSESLRASTRVSPGFALFRHSSPSFGSQHARSHSNLSPGEKWSVDGAAAEGFPPAFTFTAHGGLPTPVLAGMLDSLVRVSRRGKEKHFVSAWRPGPRRNATVFTLAEARRYLPRRSVPQPDPALATAEARARSPRAPR